MQLTGREIVSRGILVGIDLENAVQQQGVDIRLDQVSRLVAARPGRIPEKGKTILPEYLKVEPEIDFVTGKETFTLEPGYYEVVFKEGCNIPNNIVIYNIKSRSSLVRCGAHIECGQFDAGFVTDQMGCFLSVEIPIKIERGARIAQVQVLETREVGQEDLYNGQWQHDKQRTV